MAYSEHYPVAHLKMTSLQLGSGSPRALPWEWEALVYTYLLLDELPALYQSSRGLKMQVIRFLRQMRFLRQLNVAATADAPVLALTFKHCRSLQVVQASFWWPPHTVLQNQWLLRVLQNNASSIRRVQLPRRVRVSSAVLAALCRCSLLEEFDVDFNLDNEMLPDAVVARLNAQHLPHLRVLSLAVTTLGFPWEGGVTASQMEAIMARRDWRLRELRLGYPSAEALNGLQAQCFPCLEKLTLSLNDRAFPVQAAATVWLNSLGRALAAMASLRDLSLRWSGAELQEDDVRPAVWSLPQLVRLQVRWEHGTVPFLLVEAVQARTVHLSAPQDEMLALCQRAHRLQALELHDMDTHRLRLFAEQVAAGTWRQLTHLHLGALDFNIVPYLCTHPASCVLTRLWCYVPARNPVRQIADLLRCHHKLQAASILVPPGDWFEPIVLDKVNDQANGDDGGVVVLSQLEELVLHIADDALFARVTCPALTTLALDTPSVRLSTMDSVLNACPALTALQVSQVQLAHWTLSSPRHGLVSLRLSGSIWIKAAHLVALLPEPRTLVSLLAALPRLRELVLPHWPYDWEQLLECAEAGGLQCLERLVIVSQVIAGHVTSTVGQSHILRLLQACPALRSVDPGALHDTERYAINLWLQCQMAKGKGYMASLCHA